MKPIDSKHIDSHLHVRGESQYVDDVPPPPDMLHAAVFGSPKAHGMITRLATDAACAAPGVLAVLTAADIPGVNRFGPISRTSSCWWSGRCASSATRSRW